MFLYLVFHRIEQTLLFFFFIQTQNVLSAQLSGEGNINGTLTSFTFNTGDDPARFVRDLAVSLNPVFWPLNCVSWIIILSAEFSCTNCLLECVSILRYWNPLFGKAHTHTHTHTHRHTHAHTHTHTHRLTVWASHPEDTSGSSTRGTPRNGGPALQTTVYMIPSSAHGKTLRKSWNVQLSLTTFLCRVKRGETRSQLLDWWATGGSFCCVIASIPSPGLWLRLVFCDHLVASDKLNHAYQCW